VKVHNWEKAEEHHLTWAGPKQKAKKKGGGIVKTFVIILWICSMIYFIKVMAHIQKIKREWQQEKAEAQAEKEQKAEEKRKARLRTRTLWTYDRRGRKKYMA
jgi:uncharacterized membrane protein